MSALSADSQAAPFATLLTGDQAVVVQRAALPVLDGATFKYMGVMCVDQRRIVQDYPSLNAIGSGHGYTAGPAGK